MLLFAAGCFFRFQDLAIFETFLLVLIVKVTWAKLNSTLNPNRISISIGSQPMMTVQGHTQGELGSVTTKKMTQLVFCHNPTEGSWTVSQPQMACQSTVSQTDDSWAVSQPQMALPEYCVTTNQDSWVASQPQMASQSIVSQPNRIAGQCHNYRWHAKVSQPRIAGQRHNHIHVIACQSTVSQPMIAGQCHNNRWHARVV